MLAYDRGHERKAQATASRSRTGALTEALEQLVVEGGSSLLETVRVTTDASRPAASVISPSPWRSPLSTRLLST